MSAPNLKKPRMSDNITYNDPIDDRIAADAFMFITLHFRKEAKIFKTRLIKNSYQLVKDSNNTILLLEGPSGIGKSTTLLWLFHSLKNEGESVYAVLLKMEHIEKVITFVESDHSENRKVILLFDFNTISANPDRDVVLMLFSLFRLVKTNGVIVLAASSNIQLESSTVGKLIKRIFSFASDSLIYKPTKDNAKEFFLHFFPNNTDSFEEVFHITKGIPRLIALWSTSYTSLKYEEVVSLSLYEHWSEFVDKTYKRSPPLAKIDLYILVAVYCDISVSAFNVSKVQALSTYPVQTYLVDIGEENLVPKLIVPISQFTLEMVIQWTNRFAKVATDEESAIGFIYEGFIMRRFMDGIVYH